MNLIEEAARRLAQLREAGVEVPGSVQEAPASAPRPSAAPASVADAIQRLEAEVPHSIEAAGRHGQRSQSAPAAPIQRSPTVEIDLARLARDGYVTPEDPATRLASEFRLIKRPILNNAFSAGRGAMPPAPNGNLVMITSSVAGEGKTYTAINLAMSLAMEQNNTVLLVDADFSAPQVIHRLGLQTSKGLMDLLSDDKLELSDVLLRTNIEKLSLLPAGTAHPRATELIASEAMATLVAEMAARYRDRIIIFDAPPILPTTESRELATHMGQIVMVVAADRTAHAHVRSALDAISACPIVLPLLNRVTHSDSNLSRYGYGYGYGYGSSAGSGSERAARA